MPDGRRSSAFAVHIIGPAWLISHVAATEVQMSILCTASQPSNGAKNRFHPPQWTWQARRGLVLIGTFVAAATGSTGRRVVERD